jgi:outer membrane protein assembly factor BamB
MTGTASAQGRAGSTWTTASGDAQRSAGVRTDLRISRETLQKPGFQFLWKRTLEVQPRGALALTQPVFGASGFITYKGFKGLAFLGGVSGTIYSLDYDLNRMFWTAKVTTTAATPGTAACPGGVTAITMTTPQPSAPSGRGGDVTAAASRGAGAGPRPGAVVARGAVAGLYVVSSAGILHNLNLQTGTDWFPPAKFLPGENATIAGAVLVDSVMYVGTAANCGGVPNGVYAMNLAPVPAPLPDPSALPAVPDAVPASTAVSRWESHGGGVVGTGPALASSGTIFVATGDGDYSAASFSDAVVALESKTLEQKDYFTPGKTPFTSSPVTFPYDGKELVAAANEDGRIYVLDAAAPGGGDHRTPFATSTAGAGEIGALATFQDAGGTRWILAAATGSISTPVGSVAHGAVVGFTLADRGGRTELQPAWISPDLASPVTPMYVNGVVFALASGEGRRVGQPSTSAVLHALDARTGKPLWDSGTTIASSVHAIGPAVDDSQVYVVTTDGTLYAFGFVVER